MQNEKKWVQKNKSKLQTSYHRQFKLRNSNKPTKTWAWLTAHSSYWSSDRVEVQSYHLDIILATAGNVTFSKRWGSTTHVVSCKLAKCKNESGDEDHQAKYLSSKFKVRKQRHLFPAVTKRKLILWNSATNRNKRICSYCHLFGGEDIEDDRVEGWEEEPENMESVRSMLA